MPNLLQSLQRHDLGHLRIAAGLWSLELEARDAESAAAELAASLLDPGLLAETLDVLPADARDALAALVANQGRIPWPEFARRFGDIREMGPGKRDREGPHFQPASPAEALYYRALLAKAFFDAPGGALEFAYIPEDLLALIQSKEATSPGKTDVLGRPASPGEKVHPLPASGSLLDDATTLLAALRMGIAPPETDVPQPVLEGFLRAAKIILKAGPKPEAVKAFLEAPRAEALGMLAQAWKESETFDELRQLPGLACEGEWKNQPQVTRAFLLDLLEAIPGGKWWSLAAFLRDVKARYPDFQRPAGDYDSWFIKRTADGTYLRGFAWWEQVDGALVRYLITGPLFWLGRVELAAAEQGGEVTAFRFVALEAKKEEKGKITVASNGRILVERTAPRAVRYQVARFCEWEAPKAEAYSYRVSPASLERAARQGLKVEHLLSLLAKHAAGGVPPILAGALKRWEVNGTEARVQSQVILRVSRPEVLEEMRKSRAGRFLGEMLGPTAVIVKDGAQSKVLAALAELGLLAEEEK
ncbi:MAG: helicase-associated domain-containing protein [Chloroflexota bacterium]